MTAMRRFILVGAICCLAIPVLAQIRTAYDITDIRGPRSSVTMRAGAQRAQAATASRERQDRADSAKATQHVTRVNDLVRSLERRNAVQNLIVQVIDPRRQPVPGLNVVASVTAKDGSARLQNLVTNSAGRVKVSGISPLPADVRLSFAPDRVLRDGRPEWTPVNPYHTAILIRQPTGRKIAALPDADDDRFAWGGGVIFASFTVAQAPGSVRAPVYEATYETPIAVRRNAVDFELTAPSGTRVYVPATEEGRADTPVGTVGEEGRLRFQLPTPMFQAGPVPIRLARDVPGGEVETVISDYPCDPYIGVNRIHSIPPFVLARVLQLQVAGDVGVLAFARDVRDRLGDPRARRKPPATIAQQPDGSEWWKYETRGVWVKVRPGGEVFGRHTRDSGGVVERIRLVAPSGGNVGGISVGDEWGRVQSNLGLPEWERDGQASYLDGGLVFASEGGRVAWIEMARPTDLLKEGTTAFVRRRPLRVFVSSFRGDPRCRVRTADDFRRYLNQMGVVQCVNRREDADYVISATTTFEDDKGVLLGLVPMKYEATTRLTYSLWENLSGRFVAENQSLVGRSKADYGSEVAGGAALLILIERAVKDDDAKRLLQLLLGAGGISELQRSMSRAVARCPGISEQAAFNQLSDLLYQRADFAARATDIDYAKGLVTFNIGTADGVIGPRAGAQPTLFELSLGGSKYAVQESGLSANYYVAEVVSATEHSCVAQIMHVSRRVRKSREETSTKVVPDAARQIPDPRSGIVSGRVRVRFLELLPEE